MTEIEYDISDYTPYPDPYQNIQGAYTTTELVITPESNSEYLVYLNQAMRTNSTTFDRINLVDIAFRLGRPAPDQIGTFLYKNRHLIRRIIEGHSVDVDFRGNKVGVFTEDAEDALKELEQMVELLIEDQYESWWIKEEEHE